MGRTELPKEPYWDGPLSHPFYSKVVKRILDFLLALILLIPGLVMMIPLAVWVKLDSEGPVLYKAVRGGYHNQPFLIFKFRSMVVDADKTGGCTAKNDSRVTRAGRIMRRLKLDELPQLFNILKGDMSFVGPRPERPAAVDPAGRHGWTEADREAGANGLHAGGRRGPARTMGIEKRQRWRF